MCIRDSREDAPLDMRMDQRNDRTAADIVNGYGEMELYRIIREDVYKRQHWTGPALFLKEFSGIFC